MVTIKINNKTLEVDEGLSVLEAARLAGETIPAMCWHPGLNHFTSCMVCLVKDNSTGKLIPSCSVKVSEGLDILTDDDEIHEGRKTALELLLSEHVGDCEAPCQVACPAHMNIPQMNRLIAAGKSEEALRVVINDIALPSVLGRICPAPCEGACHRKSIDEAVSVCLLKRFAGDTSSLNVFKTVAIQPGNGKKIAVIGSGPAGLAAAFYLQLSGCNCTLFEKNNEAGGMLRSGIPEEILPRTVLDNEIANILNTGINFITGKEIDTAGFHKICSSYDATIIATGNISEVVKSWGITINTKGIEANANTYETSVKGIFAIGNVLRSSRLAVRSVGQGKEVASSVIQFLNGKTIAGEQRLFNSKFGKLAASEFAEYLSESYPGKRIFPGKGNNTGFSEEEARSEAARCLHCDCRKLDNCKLRNLSGEYTASQKRFSFSERKNIVKNFNHELVVYEPQKCIKCGICVRLTEKFGEKFGFTFIGRGFDVAIGIPYNEELKTGLSKTAEIVAKACPTGALALKQKL